jgi:hypothetical protein
MSPRRGWICFWIVVLQRCRAYGAGGKAVEGWRSPKRWRGDDDADNAKRLGVRQPSGALTRRLVALKQCESGSIAKSEVLVASEQRL